MNKIGQQGKNNKKKTNKKQLRAWQLEQHVKTQCNLLMQMLNSMGHALCKSVTAHTQKKLNYYISTR